MRKIYLLVLLTFLGQITKAQTSVWDGGGDGLKWGDKNNWVGDVLPKKDDLVQIANDSVLVSDDITIRKLELQPNGILYQESGNNYVFTVNKSTDYGVVIDGSAKLYVNGEFHVLQANLGGIDLQVNGSLFIEKNGLLYISQTNGDGINGGTNGVFRNKGELYIEETGSDGIDVRSFYNEGDINISDSGDAAAKINTVNGINKGELVTEDAIIIQSSAQFLNDTDGEIQSSGGISVVGDFTNNGEIRCLNTTGISLNLAGSDVFTNNGQFRFRLSNDNNLRLSNNAQFTNGEDGFIGTYNTSSSPIADLFAISMQSSDPIFTNRGKIILDLQNRREGIEIKGKGIFNNYDSVYVSNYYSKGIFISEDFSDLINLDTSLIQISKGFLPNAVGLSVTNRADVINNVCANFIVRDSVVFNGINVDLTNVGFMEMQTPVYNSSVDINNDGVIYLNDIKFASSSPPPHLEPFINNISDAGLVYHPLQSPIITGNPVQPFFRKINTANVEIVGNQIFVKNGSGLQTPSGQVNTALNSWTPPANAAGKDSVFFNYRKTGGTCPIRNLTIPFISADPCSIPQTLTFNGSFNDSWNQASNWTPARIPQPCDTVIIPSGKRCVLYNTYAGGFGNAKKILVETGAVFDTQDGTILDIAPN